MSIPRHRSIYVVLVVLAMCIPAVPAMALVSEACPTTVPSKGFTDLGGQTADTVDAIDCVAHFGIAQGTSATTFSPNTSVLRWQMALFLVRSVAVLGQTLPSGASQGFIDIGGFDTATQTAINQLKQMNITTGTSNNTFGPDGTVPRWQMALFLTRLLVNVGVTLTSGAGQGFTDISGFDAATQAAINQLRQLGISLGTSNTTFAPNVEVPRWQMALFLARSVDSAGGAPYRITLGLSSAFAQTSDTVVLTITVRNPNGTVAPGRRVDVFAASSINNNGRCVLDADTDIGSGDEGTGTNCVLDNNDPVTNSSGVITLNLTHSSNQETVTIYAWTGETGETFDLQDVHGEASVQLTWGPPPTGLELPANTLARYGGPGSITAQLIGAGGVDIPMPNQAIRFIVRRGGVTILSQTVQTIADGSATLTYTGPADPSAGDDPVTTDVVTAFWDRDNDNVDDGASEFDDTGNMNWDDDLPLATTAVLSQTEVSTLLGSFTTITITVRNKFGQGISGAEVNFDSASPNSGTTNASGVATFSYTVAAGDGPDVIDAEVDLNGDGDTNDPGDLDFGDVANLTHYWVQAAGTLSGNTEFDVIAFNSSANTIDVVEIGASNYYRLSYDSNDHFNVNGDIDESLTQFEAAMAGLTLPDLDGVGGTELVTNPYSTPASAGSLFLLETS
ncbi:MAG TPA: S-layer homology domain-containing protein [Acidimicrobiia bacterium]|nr:S-layer homology domain-containing protein [Acidimicrobiia bacterium]